MDELIAEFERVLEIHVRTVGNHSYSEILTEFVRQADAEKAKEFHPTKPFVNIP